MSHDAFRPSTVYGSSSLKFSLHIIKASSTGLLQANHANLKVIISRYNVIRQNFNLYTLNVLNHELQTWLRYRSDTLPNLSSTVQMAGEMESVQMISELHRMIRVKKITSRLPNIYALRSNPKILDALLG